jgi:hypothetical protein
MSECPPNKSEAELEADVDYMIDTIYKEIKSGAVAMSPDAVKQRVVDILKKRGMLKGGASKKSRTRRNKRSSKKKRSTRRRTR